MNEDMQQSEKSLEEILNDFYIGMKAKGSDFEKSIHFYSDILSESRLPSSLDSLIWVILFIGIDLIFILLSMPIERFNKSENDETTQFFGQFRKQQYAFSTNFVALVYLIYVSLSYYLYKPGEKLNKIHASVLQVLINHVPVITTITLGIQFGTLLRSNYQFEEFLMFSTVISLSSSFIFILIVLLVRHSQMVTEHSLYLKAGSFAFWCYPFTVLDHICFFIISTCFPLRIAGYKDLGSFAAAVLFLFGLRLLMRVKTPIFISPFGSIFLLKISLDAMLYAFLSFITLWSNIDIPLTFQLFMVFNFLTIFLASLIWNILFRYSTSCFLNDGSFDQAKISTNDAALTALRMGISFSIKGAGDISFLKWILYWRFSKEMIPDIVRICLLTKKNLKEMIVQKAHFSPQSLYSFGFLAYQTMLYSNLIAEDGDPLTQPTIEILKNKHKEAKNLIATFWNSDVNSRPQSLYSLGNKLYHISQVFQSAANTFPNCSEITDLCEKYLKEILVSNTSIDLTHKGAYTKFEDINSTIYGFLVQRPLKKSRKYKSHELENYFEIERKKATYPFLIVFSFFFLLNVAFIICISLFFFDMAESKFTEFASFTDFQILEVALSKMIMKTADDSIILPSTTKISQILGLSEEIVSSFRSQVFVMDINISYLDNLRINHNIRSIANVSGCNPISFTLIINYMLDNKIGSNGVLCHTLSTQYYISRIENISAGIVEDYENSMHWEPNRVGTIFICVLVAASIIVIIVMNRMLVSNSRISKAVIEVLSVHSHFRCCAKRDISFNPYIYIILFMFSFLVAYFLFVVFYYPADHTFRFIQRSLHNVQIVTNLTRYTQDAYAYAAIEIADNTTHSFYEERRIACLKIIEIANTIYQLPKDNEIFKIYPLNLWFSEGDQSFSTLVIDYSQLLNEDKVSISSFRFLCARFYLLYNISTLSTYTIPHIRHVSHNSMQNYIFFYIIGSTFLLLVIILVLVAYIYLHFRKNKCYLAASTILKHVIADTPAKYHKIRAILENKEPPIMEEFPFPVFAENELGTIENSNSQVYKYTNLTSNQLIGQPSRSFFDIDSGSMTISHNNIEKLLKFEVKSAVDDTKVVIIHDVTHFVQENQVYQDLLERLIPNLNGLPIKTNIIYLEIRFDPEHVKPNDILSIIDQEENGFTAAKRISCGSSFYTAVIDHKCDKNRLLSFITNMLKISKGYHKAGCTYGIASISSLDENGSRVLVCGSVAERAHQCLLNGCWGRLYMDEHIMVKEFDTNSLLPDINIIAINDVKKRHP